MATQRTQARSKSNGGQAATPPVTTGATAPPSTVAARAYELWEQSGHAHGRDKEHWFQAERELRTRQAKN